MGIQGGRHSSQHATIERDVQQTVRPDGYPRHDGCGLDEYLTNYWNPFAEERNMEKSSLTADRSASKLIDKRIAELGDWRGETLSRMRALITEADPNIVEDVKWRKPSNSMLGTPVWSHDGIICTGETYKDKVKLTFAKGASLKDPTKLFNASLDGNVRRAIDIQENEEVKSGAFKALIHAAVALNTSSGKATSKRAKLA